MEDQKKWWVDCIRNQMTPLKLTDEDTTDKKLCINQTYILNSKLHDNGKRKEEEE